MSTCNVPNCDLHLQPAPPKLTKSARSLLEKTFRAMRRHVKTFNMDDWLSHDDFIPPTKKVVEPYCGTVACLAGHIVLAATGRLPDASAAATYDKLKLSKRVQEKLSMADGYVPSVALAELGFKVGTAAAADTREKLFHTYGWPFELKADYFAAMNKRDYSKAVRVAIKRVRHWMKTGE